MANENILISDVELNWAKIVTPFKNQFGGENYELQIVVDADRADEIAAKISKEGKPTDDGRVSFNLKRKATKANGEANGAPRCVGADKAPLDGSTIGNGSKGNVIVYVFDYEFGGQSGRSHSLTAVQVTDLKVYEGGAASVDFDVIEEGTGETSPF